MNSLRTNKTKRLTIIAAVILTALFLSAAIFDLLPGSRKEAVVKGISDYEFVQIPGGTSSSYLFEYQKTGFDSIIFFIKDGDAKALSISLSDANTGGVYLKDVLISDDMCVPEGKALSVRLKASDSGRFKTGQYSVSISNVSSSSVSVAVGKNDGMLTVRLLADTSAGYFVTACVFFMLVVFLASSICVYIKNGLHPDPPVGKLFLAAAIPLCAAVIIIIPPWSTGDSEAHYLACYRLSNLFLGQSGEREWFGRADDVAFFRDIWWNSTPPSTGGYEIVKNNLNIFATEKSLVQMSATSEKMNYYSAFCYIPQTIAIILGRLIGFGPVFNCYFAKFMTAAFYIALCHRAIKKAPFGKEIIALCALLPSSLMMSSAFSYDPMVIITSLNFISSILLMREEPDNKRSLAYICIWSFILGAVKGGGYLILLPLIFLIPSHKKGLKFLNKLLPFICGLFSVAIFDLILPSGGLFQLGSKGNGFMTASFALENPLAYLKMTVLTYGRFVNDMLSDLFGSKLCWSENTIPFAFSIVMLIILLIAAAGIKELDNLKKKDVLIMLFVIFIALLSTPAMLLSWTPEGSDVILGIQGHYFLPVLPLIALVIGKGIRLIAKKTGLSGKKFVRPFKTAPYPAAAVMIFIAFYFMLRLYTSR